MWKHGVLLFLLIINSAYAQSSYPVILPGGLMKFRGQVVAGTCIIDDGDRFLTVDMGTISSNRLHQIGDYADPIYFSLHFRHCSPAVSHQIYLRLEGVADKQDSAALAISRDTTSAHGIGISLFDTEGNPLPLNSDFMSVNVSTYGPLTLNLMARYRVTSESISGGTVNAQAWFLITYQ